MRRSPITPLFLRDGFSDDDGIEEGEAEVAGEEECVGGAGRREEGREGKSFLRFGRERISCSFG